MNTNLRDYPSWDNVTTLWSFLVSDMRPLYEYRPRTTRLLWKCLIWLNIISLNEGGSQSDWIGVTTKFGCGHGYGRWRMRKRMWNHRGVSTYLSFLSQICLDTQCTTVPAFSGLLRGELAWHFLTSSCHTVICSSTFLLLPQLEWILGLFPVRIVGMIYSVLSIIRFSTIRF